LKRLTVFWNCAARLEGTGLGRHPVGVIGRVRDVADGNTVIRSMEAAIEVFHFGTSFISYYHAREIDGTERK